MSDSFSWLHLSDLHYGVNGAHSLLPNVRSSFLSDLAGLHKVCGPWDTVFVTGDLVLSGQWPEFLEMQREVLDPLWKQLEALGSGPATFLAVPGNHDLLRPNMQSIGASGVDQHALITQPLANYLNWWQCAPHRPTGLTSGLLPGDFAWTASEGNRRIGIIGLNTASLQLSDGDSRGRLELKAGQFAAVCGGDFDGWRRQHDVCFLLTHHGMAWLQSENEKDVERDAFGFTVHLFGHKHGLSAGADGGSVSQVRHQASSLFGTDMFSPVSERPYGYAAGRIQFNSGSNHILRLWPRQLVRQASGEWVFAPDYGTYELEADQGTFPFPLRTELAATTTRAKSPPRDSGSAFARKLGADGRAQPIVFLSYAWGDDSDPGLILDETAEAIFSWLKAAGYDARRDKQDLRSGDLISTYERTIGIAEHIVVVLSDKYLRSAYCMAELHNIHEHCLRDREEFLRRVTCVMLEDAAKIRDDIERLKYARYWKSRYHEMHTELTELGIEAIGLRTFERFHKIRDFWQKTDAILGYVADQLNPTGLDEISAGDFEVLRVRLPSLK